MVGSIEQKQFPSHRRAADIYGLHRNLGLFLLTSFEIASEKAKPCPRSVLMDERTRTDATDGRADADEEVVSLCIAKVTAQWILGLAWQWPRLWRDATN